MRVVRRIWASRFWWREPGRVSYLASLPLLPMNKTELQELARKLTRIFVGPEHGVCRQSDIDRLTVEVVEMFEAKGIPLSDGYVIEHLRKRVRG